MVSEGKSGKEVVLDTEAAGGISGKEVVAVVSDTEEVEVVSDTSSEEVAAGI